MKKTLKKIKNEIYHYKDGVRVEGIHSDIRGDVSGISVFSLTTGSLICQIRKGQ